MLGMIWKSLFNIKAIVIREIHNLLRKKNSLTRIGSFILKTCSIVSLVVFKNKMSFLQYKYITLCVFLFSFSELFVPIRHIWPQRPSETNSFFIVFTKNKFIQNKVSITYLYMGVCFREAFSKISTNIYIFFPNAEGHSHVYLLK